VRPGLGSAPAITTVDVAVFGAGAIGSRVVALLPGTVVPTTVDNQVVLPENLETSRFTADDCFQPKALAAAARRRAAGAPARAIHGDVRYAVSAGLARRFAALLVCLDNATAIRDVAETVWGAGMRTCR
jgi:molybdopterin/thiamine biosynthesis adenylyltransferase